MDIYEALYQTMLLPFVYMFVTRYPILATFTFTVEIFKPK
jgi:hypothetical protein